MLGQCCPNANSNASIEEGLPLREVGLRAEAVEHKVSPPQMPVPLKHM